LTATVPSLLLVDLPGFCAVVGLGEAALGASRSVVVAARDFTCLLLS
jgi:hypothetical protein